MKLTAAVIHEEPWYVARCLEVEVASQGKTADEALENLKEALTLYFEDEEGPAFLTAARLRPLALRLREAGAQSPQ